MQYSFYGGRRGYKGDAGADGQQAAEKIECLIYGEIEDSTLKASIKKQLNDKFHIVISEPETKEDREKYQNLGIICAKDGDDNYTVLFTLDKATSAIAQNVNGISSEGILKDASYTFPTDLINYEKGTGEDEIQSGAYGKLKLTMQDGTIKEVNVETITGFYINEDRHLIVSTSEGQFDAGNMAYGGIYIGKNYTWLQFNQKITDYNSNPNNPKKLNLIDGRELYTNYRRVIEALNVFYPNGLVEPALAGKLITYADTEDESKVIFGFDYEHKTWYYVGSVNEDISYISSCIIVGGANKSLSEAAKLPQGGLWFKTEDINISPIPIEAQQDGNLNYRCAFVCDTNAWASTVDNKVDVINEKLSIIKTNARLGSVAFIFETVETKEDKIFMIHINTSKIEFTNEDGANPELFDKDNFGDPMPVTWDQFKKILFGEDGKEDRDLGSMKITDEVSTKVKLVLQEIPGESFKIPGAWVSYSNLVVNDSYNALAEFNMTEEEARQSEFFFPLYSLKGYTSAIKDDDFITTGDKFYLGFGFQSWYLYAIAKRTVGGSDVVRIPKEN